MDKPLKELLDEAYISKKKYMKVIKPRLYEFLKEEVSKTSKYRATERLAKILQLEYGRGYSKHTLTKIYDDGEKLG